MAKDIRAAVKAAGNLQVEEPTKPVEPTAEAAKDQSPAPDSGPGKYSIELPFVPAHTVEANDRYDAIEKYKNWSGVISSEHPFKVSKVTE